jgi:GDSL-like Lipase/Acylhydrolase family
MGQRRGGFVRVAFRRAGTGAGGGVPATTTVPGISTRTLTPAEWAARFPNIMPLGDSTTAGSADNVPNPAVQAYWTGVGNDGTAGYRSHLLQFMRAFGVMPFSWAAYNGGNHRIGFVGTIAGTSLNLPDDYRSHQGLAGQTLAQMNTAFPGVWVGTNTATLIVLSGGINDIGIDLQTPAQTAARLNTLLNTINTTAPGVPVLFWSPPASAAYQASLLAFEPLAAAVVAAQQASGRPYWFVSVTDRVDEVNTVHPNAWGYRDIAGLIFWAIQTCPV